MTQLKNKTILITGGASGIGKIMSRLSLEKNAKVIIWDINTQNIENTLKELSTLGNIFSYVVDVSNLVQIQESAKKTKDEHGNIDILINNAGIVVGKYFHEHTAESAILRAEKLAAKNGEDATEHQIAMSKLYLYQAIKNCNQSGEEVILSFAEGDEQRMLLMGLKRFTKGYTINPKEMRRNIAAKLIEENQYCF